MKKIIHSMHNNKLLKRILHTLNYEIEKELTNCTTVLDIGCGPDSPLRNCEWVEYSVGVEPFTPYLELSRSKNIHKKYINENILSLNFKENEFDAVMMIDVIEHLPKYQGEILIEKAENWARKKIIISTPNGFVKQKSFDGNKLQEHLSGWKIHELNKRGYSVRGMAGFKILRQEVDDSKMEGDLFGSIRYRPKIIWFAISTISQIISYRIPFLSFSLFAVKEKNE